MKKIILFFCTMLSFSPLNAIANQSENVNTKDCCFDSDTYHPILKRTLVASELIKPDMANYRFSLVIRSNYDQDTALNSVKTKTTKLINTTLDELKDLFGNSFYSFSNSPVLFTENSRGHLTSHVEIEIIVKTGSELKVDSYLSNHSNSPEFYLNKDVSFFVSDDLMSKSTNRLTLKITKNAYTVASNINKIHNDKWSLDSLSITFKTSVPGSVLKSQFVGQDNAFQKMTGLMSISPNNQMPTTKIRSRSIYIKAFGSLVLKGFVKIK